MNKFDTFSEAFRHVVDNSGLNHVDIYSSIRMDSGNHMDKGYFSKVYNGEIKNPRQKVRKKLTDVVGVDIKKTDDGWIIGSYGNNVSDSKDVIKEESHEYDPRKDARSASEKERDLLIDYLVAHAESLAEGLRRLRDFEKKNND